VAVAAGLVSFALGTDTAGSGRVPAAFNSIVGHKPTRGLISTRGVVPACRSLDCVSIFALTAVDAAAVLRKAATFDAADPFARRATSVDASAPAGFSGMRCGVPRRDQLEFFGNRDAAELFDDAVARIEALGGTRVEIDFEPFLAAARLLYEGPWVAERYVAIRDFIERHPDALHPATRAIIGSAVKYSAVDSFTAYYRLKALRRATAPVWDMIDLLLTPTAGTIYRVAEVEADPIRLNTNLGYYTNFLNLLDLCAIAVPAGFQRNGLPFGITLVAPPFRDSALCVLGDIAQRAAVTTMGATRHALLAPRRIGPIAPDDAVRPIRIAVCGAHMAGLPLNHQLTDRGARLARVCRPAPHYRLYALTVFAPPRPGMVRSDRGAAIAVEVWELPAERFGSFVDGIPAPLGIGTVTLEDGREVRGFLCESYAVEGARDITALGGWRAFVESS
jgi:allophanate hydrolase